MFRRNLFNLFVVFTLVLSPLIGMSSQTIPVAAAGTAPHYFSVPNYANSPLRLPDAIVQITGGGGTGATATAAVDPATGAITTIDIVTPGSGYTAIPDVVISTAVVNPTVLASAVATVDYSGTVTGITVDLQGGGYAAPAVQLQGGGGSGATATAYGGVDLVNVVNGGTGYTQPVVEFTLPEDPNGTAASAAATIDANGTITGVTVVDPGSGYKSAPAVTFRDGADPNMPGPGTGATGTATMKILAITLDTFGRWYTSAPSVLITDTVGQGTGASATASITAAGTGAVTGITITNPGLGYMTPGIKKFVDSLPGLGPDQANNLGQYIPVAIPDQQTYPGSDYYEIAVVQYREQMHTDLPATLLRGYVQLSTSVVPGASVALSNANQDGSSTAITLNGQQVYGVDNPHYLGPLISATKDRPVRILFRNLLPTGTAGNLFLPVDTTVMGSGMGPNMGGMADPDPRNPMCGDTPKPADCYTENRATLHLHGGITPWISDGTPHQWITPANETTPYPKGVSVQNVPDMPDPGPGAMTFFYTNQQSARLMFYHDHAWGITRLNVYAGEAAGYLITDDTEKKLIADQVIPDNQIPLIIQEKTFVPSNQQLSTTDPLWDTARWGGYGQLWVPHVYMPAQNPGDASGVNAFGRWAYGPWFWPPTANIDYPPVANPYYDPNCNPDQQWCEPQLMPGVPYLSMGMEAFNDTPLVNGTAYPYVNVEPKSYRFRILNAADDRFFNLSLYQADPTGTEVALNAAEVQGALTNPAGVFPTPDTSISPAGPNWIQIGTEGGFLPSPVVIPPHPITWVTDPTVFNAGNVDQHSLLVGPAERADVIVDFSRFAGKTLILYNDAPAAFPARDPRYDYYTGNADLTSSGGAPTTPAGFGPNTRTVMQIRVAATTPAAAFNMAPLTAAFNHHLDQNGNPAGVFEASQNPIIVGQGAYNQAYGTSFQSNGSRAGLVNIHDEYLSFDTLSGASLRMPLERKAIQDEMGEAFEQSYGRMSGNLGVEAPNAQAGQAQNLILYPYINPSTEVMNGVEMQGMNVTPIATLDDGTQIWKITHNGVDTHPIHFHLYDVQVINRVGWDGIIRKPDANELGWKDTVRISPLEDTIVAMRPIIPKMPFGVPDSIRPLNPMMPLGSPDGFNSTDIFGNPITPAITNQMVNFGWEYVWHCHILSHEEMDMMRPISVNVSRYLPYPPAVTFAQDLTTGAIHLTWTEGTPVNYLDLTTWGNPSNEVGFYIERAIMAKNGKLGAYSRIGQTLANTNSFVDNTAVLGTTYRYQVLAYNAAGSTGSAPVGGSQVTLPANPTNLAAAMQNGPQVSLSWTDNATNESFYVIERSQNSGPFYVIKTVNAGSNTMSYIDKSVQSNQAYQYRVAAINSAGSSAYAVSATLFVPNPPAAPSNLTGTTVVQGKKANITLNWTDNSTGETGFVIERATNAAFTVGLNTSTVAANTVTVTQTGLYRGVTYFFRIKAVNNGIASTWSNVFSIVTP